VALAFLGAAVIAGNIVRVPYVLVSPGDAMPLDDQVISISDAPTFTDSGEFLFLTVRVSNRDPSLWRYLFAKLDDDITVTKREDIIGCASYEESAKLQVLLMNVSQESAKTVALQRLGYEVTEENNRVVISNVLCGGPSFGALQAADEVLSVDDQPVATAEDVGVFVQMHEPGDDVRFNVTRDGIEQELTVRAGHTTKNPNRPCALGEGGGNDAIACVGIQDQNIVDLKFPFKIEIDTNRVSGPSAGLAFTLSIIDSLTDGSLTGGGRVAVTGAILSDGTVVPVGGVEQKAAVASSAGAMLMLVPACPKPLERDCEAEPARAHADGMRVVIVETIGDALRALERAGGDPIPPRPDPATAQ
jgi:PDZ domain-containing protein